MDPRKRIFQAVFPPPSQKSLPTPSATPVLGSGSFGGSFENFQSPQRSVEDSASETLHWERAWHNATAFLSLQDAPITLKEASQGDDAFKKKWIKSCNQETSDSISYLVSENSIGRRLRAANQEDDLVRWYSQEVGRHYVDHQLPVLHRVRMDLNVNLTLSNKL